MRIKAIVVLGLVLWLTGCATLFKGSTQEVNFNSNPQKVQVVVNGVVMGETPCALKLEVKKTYDIEFKAEGYKTKAYHITNHVGAGWIVLDVLGGLVPVIIDAVTGAWYSLDQKNIDTVLEKQRPR
jgi:hypothetical protein